MNSLRYIFTHGILAAILTSVSVLVGCEQTTEPITQPDTKVRIGTSTVDGLTIDLYSDDSLITGYNRIYIRLRRGTTVINDAHVHAYPLMDMGMMKHSCPVEEISDVPTSDGYFTGAVIFTMPGTSSQWSIEVAVHDHTTDADFTTTFALNVATSNAVKVLKIDGQGKRIVTLKTTKWAVGMNTIDFLVHSTVDGFEYMPVTDITPFVDPTMPSMGHGSPGNVNPTHSHDGLYTGKVNFTMTGDWDIAFGWTENDMPQVVHFPVLVN